MRIHGSPALVARLELEAVQAVQAGAKAGSLGLGSVDVTVSHLFPYKQSCAVCNGTGEGLTSTYCPSCHGAGAVEIIGAMLDGRDSFVRPAAAMFGMIQGKRLPPRFLPRFPAGIVSLPPMCRGLA